MENITLLPDRVLYDAKKFGFEEWGRMPQTVEIDGKLYDHCYYGLKLEV